MNDITICMAYYINKGMLEAQYTNLANQSQDIKDHLRYIVVDDCSPTDPATPPKEDIGVPVEIYRAREDIPWNQDWARNLAVLRAKTRFVLLTDMDHVPSTKLLRKIVECELNSDYVYTFRRVSAPDKSAYKPHPNSWLMTVAMYDAIGGYDERYRGCYGTDGMFKERVRQTAKKVCEFKEALIRYPREVIPDASTTTLTRKSEHNEAIRRDLHAQVRRSRDPRPHRFLMKWDRVY